MRLQLLMGPAANVVEAIVSLTRGVIDSWREIDNVRPALQMDDAMRALISAP